MFSPGGELFPPALIEALLHGQPSERPEEEFCRRLFKHLVEAHVELPKDPDRPNAQSLAVQVRDICEHPQLLSALPALPRETFDGFELDSRVSSVRDVSDCRLATSILLLEPSAISMEGTGPQRLGRLRQWLQAHERTDLLSRLGPALTGPEQLRIHSEQGAGADKAYELLGAIRKHWLRFDQMAEPEERKYRHVVAELEQQGTSLDSESAALLRSWADRVLKAASELSDYHRRGLDGKPGNFALNMALGSRPAERRRCREVLWRTEALSRFSDIRGTLQKVKDSGPAAAGEGASDLVDRWLEGLTSETIYIQRSLRRAFLQFIFGSGGETSPLAEQARIEDREGIFLPAAGLRHWLSEQHLNPSFLPQLARIPEIAILTPASRVRSQAFSNKAGNIVSAHGKSLAIVLAPQITREMRDRCLEEFQKRRVLAAVIDDIDLCRLLNPEGARPNLVLGLFEIALEQQNWDKVRPFEPQEGQNVKVETYVGRHDEASDLATTAHYSRLFSGRKLGKSALLRFITETYDHKPLPSGNALRVLYVPAVGADGEADIVSRILEEMQRALQLQIENKAREAPPETLRRAIGNFLTSCPAESLLVFLDEADRFVEAQLEEFEKHKEACLSFRMRSEIESHRDSMGLPRVRFLFSGYRATRTTEGAWANWGEVLVLKPLSSNEAAELIEGPLARIGIDATEQADAIAFRCGYQPAVILRFGEELLRHIRDSRPANLRQRVIVTADDVSACFSSDSVREEIRTIVRNNFQGDKVAGIVFSALLREYAELPPGAYIEEAEDQVLRRIAEADSDTSWLHQDTSAALTTISAKLRDMVERKILKEMRSRSGSRYRLTFPHHLGVLCHPDQLTVIRDGIAAIRSFGGGATPYAGYRSLLPPALLRELSGLLIPQDPDCSLEAIVIASVWAGPVTHKSGGVASRLGVPLDCQNTPSQPLSVSGVSMPRLALVNPDLSTLDWALEQRPRELQPLIALGGADLMRWGLRVAGGGERNWRLIEVRAIGRLEPESVAWWFERVHCFEFTDQDWLNQVLKVTSGIPYLVGALDKILSEHQMDGENVTSEKLQMALSQFKQNRPAIARDLLKGETSVRLESRETEILLMVAKVCRENPQVPNLLKELTTDWEYYGPAEEQISAADRSAVDLLLQLGFLPRNPKTASRDAFDSLIPLESSDALFDLAQALKSAS